MVKQLSFVSGVDVAYGEEASDQPPNSILEIHGQNADINKGFGGAFVWITSQFSSNALSACTYFQIVIQSESDSDLKDLAKGAGGDFRYILPFNDEGNPNKIFDLGLLRSDDAVNTPPPGYNGMTIDINQGRGGDFLYVVWKSVVVP